MRELVPFGHFCSRQVFGGPWILGLAEWQDLGTVRLTSRTFLAHECQTMVAPVQHGPALLSTFVTDSITIIIDYAVQMLCAFEVFGYETMWGTRTACAGGSAEANEMWLDASRTCQKYPKDFKRCFATHCCAISKGSTWFGWTLVGYDVYSFDFFWQVWLIFVYFPCQGLHYVATMFDHSHSWDDHDYHDIRNDFLPLLNPLPILENCELGFEPEKGHCCSDLFSQIVSQKCFFRKYNI